LRAIPSNREDFVVTPLDDPQTLPLSMARRALAEFAERNPPTQADIDQVMRALVTHVGWFVPVEVAERMWRQTDFEQFLYFAEAAPSRVLNVFTDYESAILAEGRELGRYGGPVSGVDLMAALTGELDAIIVNPASRREHQWYIASAGFEIARSWATAVAVERALADRGNGPVPVARLLGHRYQVLLEQPTHALAQISLPDIGTVGVCFTAADRGQEFISSLPMAARPLADLAPIEGPELFELMHGVGVAGLVVNAGSDDQAALTDDDIAQVVEARLRGG
jgi:hypothetical protein